MIFANSVHQNCCQIISHKFSNFWINCAFDYRMVFEIQYATLQLSLLMHSCIQALQAIHSSGDASSIFNFSFSFQFIFYEVEVNIIITLYATAIAIYW